MGYFWLYRWLVMRMRGGFWVRKVHWADISFLPIFPWRWIAPHERFKPSDFVGAAGCVTHTRE